MTTTTALRSGSRNRLFDSISRGIRIKRNIIAPPNTWSPLTCRAICVIPSQSMTAVKPPCCPSSQTTIRQPMSLFSSMSNPTLNEGTKSINESSKGTPDSTSSVSESSPIPDDFEYNPTKVISDLALSSQWARGNQWNPQFCHKTFLNYQNHLRYLLQNPTHPAPPDLISPFTAGRAVKTLIKSRTPTPQLSLAVRDFERLLGSIKIIPLTDELSFRLLEANGKAGNVGRTLQILNLRGERGFRTRRGEFTLAIQSVKSATLPLREHRNVYVGERDQPMIDNPTRWLDAILVSMAERGVGLDTVTANRMLDCYASTGRTGKAVHWFYRTKREGLKEGEEGWDNMPTDGKGRFRYVMEMNNPPSYYKVPSEMKTSISGRDGGEMKLFKESQADYSLPLTAAFAFADSLTHGACGHKPIELDVTSWNTLIKVCCYRGAMWRATHIVNVIMPRMGISPDTYSYNTILHGLARLGDRAFLKEFLITMTNKQIPFDQFTVQALVDGLLNVGDISGAVTIVQDTFNQHQVLPPYTTHLKIIEFALGNKLTYEAKRHVFFIQQLWKSDRVDIPSVKFVKNSPKLSKEALTMLFRRFGKDLTEDDFF